eukprot:scaffold20189_cov58-Phaeocystis_antarctica.AAC.4
MPCGAVSDLSGAPRSPHTKASTMARLMRGPNLVPLCQARGGNLPCAYSHTTSFSRRKNGPSPLYTAVSPKQARRSQRLRSHRPKPHCGCPLAAWQPHLTAPAMSRSWRGDAPPTQPGLEAQTARPPTPASGAPAPSPADPPATRAAAAASAAASPPARPAAARRAPAAAAPSPPCTGRRWRCCDAPAARCPWPPRAGCTGSPSSTSAAAAPRGRAPGGPTAGGRGSTTAAARRAA